jgi:hypothetical protein
MTVESMGIAEWLYTTLSGGTVLSAIVGTRIYEDVAPQGTALPYVVYSQTSSMDENGIGGSRLCENALWTVQGVAKAMTYNAVKSIAVAIDDLLHGVLGTATANGVTVACTRQEEVRYSEVREGVTWRHLGGVYRIYAGGTGT